LLLLNDSHKNIKLQSIKIAYNKNTPLIVFSLVSEKNDIPIFRFISDNMGLYAKIPLSIQYLI